MKIISIIMLTLFPMTPLFAEPVDFFIQKAFENSPVLKQQLYKTEFSKENYKKESIFQSNPVISFGYSNVPVNKFPSLDKHPMSGISIGLSQYIAAPWEDYYRKKSFYSKYLSEKESYDEARNLLAFQVQSAYHQILFLHKKRNILNQNKLILENIQRTAESLVSVNRMSSAQLLKVRADLSTLNGMITELDGEISVAKADMNRLCGIDLQWTVTGAETDQWIRIDQAGKVPEGFSYHDHPLYKKVSALYKSQESAYQMELARLSPGVTLGIEYRYRELIPNDNPTAMTPKDKGEDFISLKASMPIPLFYPLKEHHSIKAARESMKALKEMQREIQLELSSKWEGESMRHKKLAEAFVNFNKTILPEYWASYKAHIGSLSAGTVSLIDVLDAYRRYLTASLDEARLYRDLMISRLRLNYLLYSYPGTEFHKPSKGESGNEKK